MGGFVTHPAAASPFSVLLACNSKVMRTVVPHMIKAGGVSIVNVASKAATSGAIAGVAYTASKYGIVSSSILRYDTSS
jgi:NADP-dependent 3-hydroxy acid dehydrogenase YdfG